ncbi:hypothetical protein AM493_18225 [Flavobacterium akiainvivens]|uniref:VCBS repeat-containing protein n=1 Tax=Flavobacterium akiainvivens TaxID=1202724 RepID=A0A0N0RR18_9FLAO|nr:hypothetical protein [Flavobacterium akiainvivens]KOS07772.1 hypothetical protein AM493_18225 [Flavobacterium akiainvivens]SFQ25986.1 hypothetical protein SAMN05444144_102226 [Flavobacterium akiainvivens]
MKCTAAIVFALLLTFSASAQKKAPKGYTHAPALTITGDFNGDGKQDTLSQFVADSLGNKLDYILDTGDWDTTIPLYTRMHYYNEFTLNGSLIDINRQMGVGLLCLINLGNINSTKGDEVALVPFLKDYSNLNHCRIYSYCSGNWAEVFNFNINEMDFIYTGSVEPVFTAIPGRLEKQNGTWVYIDYMDWFEDPTIPMKPLKVPNCN